MRIFDKDGDGTIDFIEFMIATDMTHSGTPEEKLRWAFKVCNFTCLQLVHTKLRILSWIKVPVVYIQGDLTKSALLFILWCVSHLDSQNKPTLEHCLHTVVLIWESKWPDLWSKWPIFDLVFCCLKLPPCSDALGSTLPLTGPLKWGKVWTSTSTGTGIMKNQNWAFVFY